MVTETIVAEFKERMHITHSGEDDNLKRLLSFSVSALQGSCGEFDIERDTDIDHRAKELVFERTRYVYNDALEYFEKNFLSALVSLGIDIAIAKDGDLDAEV